MQTRLPHTALLAGLASLIAATASTATPVTLREVDELIPTYLMDAPDPNPQFYFGGSSQGAQNRVYPYPLYDNLTAVKADKRYRMVYLENEYVKIGILPDSGGKIFEAIDKTDGYHFFYRQHVIKPALISLLGAWISGGVEWDIPHHHRATSFLPTQYAVASASDGSKTVWVGELELRDRTRWAVGVTLHPGKSYLEVAFRMANRTPVPVSMLCFANVAVHVNENYQVIFPPRTQWGTGHGKRDFTPWPIDRNNVDLSWYKNIPGSRSVFAWNYLDDFSAGYDHGKQAGTMSIADHNVVPGKKFFTWGDGPTGHLQDHYLTDSDGPYIELMVGAYSDNQPDYSWLAPHETRSWTQFWYPFRGIGGVKNANIEAAVNLEVKEGQIHVGFCSTSDRPAAEVTLKLKDQVLIRETVAINPGKPYVKQLAFPAGADEHNLRATLSAQGRELVAYAPIRLQPEPEPKPVTNFPAPADFKTTEELYFAGLRVDQFRAPNTRPEIYWEEALKRDPGDVRVNTVMGLNAIKSGRFAEAEPFLRKALERATDRHTSPKDGEPFYYLGLALKRQGKIDDAFNQFSKSTWSGAWRNAGYFEMAQIATLRGDFPSALTYDNNSLNANSQDVRALALKAALLRHTGKSEEALATANAILRIDPLDLRAQVERTLTGKAKDAASVLLRTCAAFPATALEAAADYLNAGLWQDGTALLTQVVNAAPDKARVSPLAYYYLGYFAQQLNQPQKAGDYYQLAAKAPTDYVFPFQMEMIAVLEQAMQANPADSRAPYYLGNLLYNWQPDRAVALWERSAAMGADFPVVYRNLALIYTRQGNPRDQVLATLEKAASFGGSAMVFNDLDRLYEENGVVPEKRLALLENHQSVINRDDVIAREINLALLAGKTDLAIRLIRSRFFRAWEGGGRFTMGHSWINAQLVRGAQHFAAKQFKEALADYQAALQMPSSLQESAGNVSGRKGEIAYWIGAAYEALGDMDKARQSWRDATVATDESVPGMGGRRGTGGRGDGPGGSGGLGGRGGGGGALPVGQFSGRTDTGGMAAGTYVPAAAVYYQALAHQKLGEAGRAKALFEQVLASGKQLLSAAPALEETPTTQQRSQVGTAHYVIGLGYAGLGEKEKAREALNAALASAPDHLGAKLALQCL